MDYLYHGWKGKPAAIISYGGHGGGKAASQLAQVRRPGGVDLQQFLAHALLILQQY